MESRCPYVLDTTGQDVHAEAEALREQGSVARVELLAGPVLTDLGYELSGVRPSARARERSLQR